MSKSNTERFYVTTPIYYVNARPHLGHAYSTIVCDAIARRKRALGIETFFLTGTDEHGQKIERSAELAGRTPMDFATAISGEFRGLWDQLGMSYDDFIRTTSERHKRGVQKLFATLQERGFIYKGSYSGQYCVSDELYVDGPPGTVCPDCGRVTETVSEENFFFKLSAFERKLLEFYEANPGFMGPESTRREVISFVRGGLKDLSVSRTSFSWGIPVPGDEKHVVYVWLDALANYITALGYGSDAPEDQERFKKFWPADLHLIGKEISRFHCVYWPAFLMAAGIPLPRSVRANGWLLFDQGKMSKSKGNIVRAETVQAVLGADALRYYLLREVPFGQDGTFSFEALVQRYNSDLANGYGNLVSRVVNMVHKYFSGIVPEAGAETPAETALRESAVRTIAAFGPAFEEMNFSDALKGLWTLVAETDGYLTANAPWKKPVDRSDADHAALQARVLATAAEAIRVITALVYPVLPDAAGKVWRQLGQGEIADAAKNAFLTDIAWGGLQAGTRLGEPAPLFPRAEKDAVERMQTIEEQNSKSVIEAAGGSAVQSQSATSAPAAKAAKGAAVSEIVKTLSSEAAVPVDSVGVDAAEEAKAYDAVAAATTAAAKEQADYVPTSVELNAVAPQSPGEPVAAAPAVALAAEQPPASPVISIDDVMKLDLRVAQILVAERVPKADKLLRLEVDLGYEKRQILAGIAQYYEPEKLVGRKIVIVANLAPRKMRGLESNGMLLAASLEGGAPVLAGFLEEVPLGSRLK
jgi:methionyl-tRNA synthetase